MSLCDGHLKKSIGIVCDTATAFLIRICTTIQTKHTNIPTGTRADIHIHSLTNIYYSVLIIKSFENGSVGCAIGHTFMRIYLQLQLYCFICM